MAINIFSSLILILVWSGYAVALIWPDTSLGQLRNGLTGHPLVIRAVLTTLLLPWTMGFCLARLLLADPSRTTARYEQPQPVRLESAETARMVRAD